MRARAGLSTSTCCQWMLPARRNAKSSVPGGDGRIGLAVDQDEGAELGVVGVALERDRLVQVQVAVRDFVELELLGREVLLRIDVDLVLDLGHLRADRARADLQPVRASGQQRLFAQPQQVRRELVGDFRRIGCRGDDIATAGVDLVGERQRDRPTAFRAWRDRHRRSRCAVDSRATSRRQHDDVVAGRIVPAATVPANPRKSWFGRQTHCTGSGSRLPRLPRHVDRFEVAEQRRAAIPRRRLRALEHVVPLSGPTPDAGDVGDPQLARQFAIRGLDLVERPPGHSRRGPSC